MPNLVNFRSLENPPSNSNSPKTMSLLNIYKLDCTGRVAQFINSNAKESKSTWSLIVGATVLQVLLEYLPFIAWFTWPFLVYICAQCIRDQVEQKIGIMESIQETLKALKSNGEVVIALLLYGALSLIIFRGLMEILNWAQIGWDLLPRSVNALLPFTISEALAVLFIATCAYRLNNDDSDPFKTLSLSLRDLFLSPVSTLIILLIQSVLLTYLTMSLTFYLRAPLISTFVGHAPFVFFVLVWIGGQPIEKQDQSWIESST